MLKKSPSVKPIYLAFICLSFLACKHKAPPPAAERNLKKINILNSINGTPVVGTEFNIYESGSSPLKKIYSNLKSNQCGALPLKTGRNYDFEVLGVNGKYAGSYLKNFKITDDTETITIIQPELFQNHRETVPPSLTGFKMAYTGVDGNFIQQEITDGTEMETPFTGRIFAEIAAGSLVAEQSFKGGFSVKLGLGRCPNYLYGISPNGNPILSEVEKIEDGVYKGMYKYAFVFDVFKTQLEINGQAELVLTVYDAAGNRLEAHHYLKIKKASESGKPYSGTDIKIQNLTCTVKTVAENAGLYSAAPSNTPAGQSECEYSTYIPSVSFQVLKHGRPENIRGFELYRQDKNSSDKKFKKAASEVYEQLKSSNQKLGSGHTTIDSSGSLEYGKQYAYMVKVFLKDGSYIESKPVEVTLMKPFKAVLKYPENHQMLNAAPDKFTFKISDAGLFKKENADYFDFGFVIFNWEGRPVFSSKYRYWPHDKKTGKPELEIGVNNFSLNRNLKTIKELKAEGLTAYSNISDFILIDDDGTVSILAGAVNFPVFNFEDNSPLEVEAGSIYFWDICSFDAGGKRQPVNFVKINYDSNLQTGISETYGSSFLEKALSANGMFDFSIDKKAETPSAENAECIKGFYIVKAKKDFDFASVTNLNVRVCNSLNLYGDEFYYLVYSEDDKDFVLSAFLNSKGIICAEPNYKLELIKPAEQSILSPFLNPKAAHYTNDPVEEMGSYSLVITEALKAYKEFGYGENKILAAIIDSGINKDHEDFKNEENKPVFLFTDTAHDTDDSIGHGTHTAGIIAAVGNNGKGIAGTAWKNTSLAVYNVFSNEGNVWTIYEALSHFTHYVKTERAAGRLKQNTVPVNMSFGSRILSMLALETVNEALANGVLPIAASGNEGTNLINYPAAYTGVIAVSSSGGQDKVSPFSTGGKYISICAPGAGIISTGNRFDDEYVCKSGTSMAAPFVTGMIAYLLSFKPELTPSQIKTLLEDTADKIDGANDFDERRGFGRVNVYKACRKLKTLSGTTPEDKFFSGRLIISVSKNGKPAVNQPVFLYNSKKICIAMGRTASTGSIEFRGLPYGKYTAKVNTAKHSLLEKEGLITKTLSGDVTIEFK